MKDLAERLRTLAAAIKDCEWELPITAAEDCLAAAAAADLNSYVVAVEWRDKCWDAEKRLAAAEAARDIAEQQLTVICNGVNRRCGKGPNELPLVSVDGVVKERDEFRKLLREVLRGRRRFMRDSLGKELYEAVEKAAGVK